MASGTINKNMVLLWENPNPVAVGASEVNLDLSKYKFVRVLFRTLETQWTIGSAGIVAVETEVGGDSSVVFSFGNIDTAYYAHLYTRWVMATTAKVDWSTCYDKSLNSTTAAGAINNALIPLKIYGIKA